MGASVAGSDPGASHFGIKTRGSEARRSRERAGLATMAIRDLVHGNNRPLNAFMRGPLFH